MKLLVLLVIILSLQGCGIRYFDTETGTNHLWGLGHLKIRTATDNGSKALATGSTIYGLNLNLGKEKYSIGVGYSTETRVLVYDPTKDVYIIWYDNLFDMQIGQQEEEK